jgi:uncharacterized protein (DUF169 family)
MIDPSELQAFKEALSLGEMPLAAFATDIKPEEGISSEKAHCVLSVLHRARRKHATAFFSRGQLFCPGGQLYINVVDEIPDFIPAYVSTGKEGMFEGERYCRSPEIVMNFLKTVKLDPDPRLYRVFKPLDLLAPGEEPEVVIFFETPDVLSGLYTLVQYATGAMDSVAAPWGAGCCGIYAWVRRFELDGTPKAVLAGFDVSARPYMGRDELTLAMPFAMFKEILGCYRDSFVFTKSWGTLNKRIASSRRERELHRARLLRFAKSP